MHDHHGWPDRALRAVLAFDGVVFLSAALLNFGARIPMGLATLRFPVHIWQAGLGETVIGLTLLAAAFTARRRLAWLAFGLSVFGILFGLSSRQVVGPARDIHVLLVPLTLAVGGLLLRRGRHGAARRPAEPVATNRRAMGKE